MSNPRDAVPLQDDAGAIVAGGQALMRLENTQMMQVAIQQPRDEAAILASCLKELTTYESAAETAIYCKPVGRDPKKAGAMQFARELSIHAAQSISLRWTNSGWKVEVLAEDDETVTIGAVWLDYEARTQHQMVKRVAKTFKSRGQGTQKIAADRLHSVVVPAAQSRLLREVILRSLPAGLKTDYRRRAEECIPKLSEAGRARMLALLAEYGFQQPQLEKMIGCTWEAMGKDEYLNLLGTYEAVRAGEMSNPAGIQVRQRQVAAPADATPDPADVQGKGEAPDRDAPPAATKPASTPAADAPPTEAMGEPALTLSSGVVMWEARDGVLFSGDPMGNGYVRREPTKAEAVMFYEARDALARVEEQREAEARKPAAPAPPAEPAAKPDPGPPKTDTTKLASGVIFAIDRDGRAYVQEYVRGKWGFRQPTAAEIQERQSILDGPPSDGPEKPVSEPAESAPAEDPPPPGDAAAPADGAGMTLQNLFQGSERISGLPIGEQRAAYKVNIREMLSSSVEGAAAFPAILKDVGLTEAGWSRSGLGPMKVLHEKLTEVLKGT